MVLSSLCFLFLPVVHSTGMTKDKEAILVAPPNQSQSCSPCIGIVLKTCE